MGVWTVPKAIYNGKEVDGEDISFSVNREDWNSYQLHDGTELRMRLIVSQVIRIPGEYDADGNPVYSIKSSNMAVTIAPDALKRESTG